MLCPSLYVQQMQQLMGSAPIASVGKKKFGFFPKSITVELSCVLYCKQPPFQYLLNNDY